MLDALFLLINKVDDAKPLLFTICDKKFDTWQLVIVIADDTSRSKFTSYLFVSGFVAGMPFVHAHPSHMARHLEKSIGSKFS